VSDTHGLLVALSLLAFPAIAQELSISALAHYTENRGWNEAGLGPTHQIVATAKVEPSGFPTLVFAEQNGRREPLTLFPGDVYVLWQRFDPAFTGAWRIVAERGGQKGASASTPPIARPREVPLALDVRVAGKGARPSVAWKVPDTAKVQRVRVGVRGGARIQGRFLGLLHVSAPLPGTATSFRVPVGWLEPGGRYVFQVMLEDLEDGRLANRSLAFSDPYAVPSASDGKMRR
jgi:hypothetical protein